MHFALVSHGLPLPSSNGGPMTCWAIAKAMLDEGHGVTVIYLAYPSDPFNTSKNQEMVVALGARLVEVPVDERQEAEPPVLSGTKVGRFFKPYIRPDFSSTFPTSHLAPKLRIILEKLEPDAIFAYHWDSLAALKDVDVAPKMAGVGDLWHLPNYYRWRQLKPSANKDYLRHTLGTLSSLYWTPKYMLDMLQDCQAQGAFAAQYADWLSARGADCNYLRTPLISTVGSEWRQLRENYRVKSKPKILLGPSNLNSTVTSQGLSLFATDVLPALEAELGPDSFEVHIIGSGEPPRELASIIPRPSIKMRGRVADIDQEFLTSDMQLVPTSIELGVRVRIITSFTFGCPVVAHRANAMGIPELEHKSNAMLASDGRGMAKGVVEILRDIELRDRLEINARSTFEKYFSAGAAAAPIVAELVRLANKREASLSLS